VAEGVLYRSLLTPSTWTQEHRRWLARQAFDEPMTGLAFADALTAVDGLTARKAALLEQLILDSHAGVRLPRRSGWTGRVRRESSERETRRGQS
jgi:hypothetical protein